MRCTDFWVFLWNGVCLDCPSPGTHLLWDCLEKAQSWSSSMHHHCERLMSQRKKKREEKSKGTVCDPEFGRYRLFYFCFHRCLSHYILHGIHCMSHSFQFLLWAIEAIFHMAAKPKWYKKNYILELEGCGIRCSAVPTYHLSEGSMSE